MTDLLDQLAQINPVPGCDPPAIDDVWRKLDGLADELAGSPPTSKPRRGGLLSRGMRSLPALVGVAVCLVVVIVAITGPRAGRPRPGVDGGTRPAWNATGGQGPSLSALMAHFAVLRRPPTAADRAARARFAVGVGSAGRTEYPTFVRLAGDANGIPVYFVVYADHRHGATGPVVGYSMQIVAGGGASYAAGFYMIFPNVQSAESAKKRSEYLSIVPDGVRMVRWRFACPSNANGCVLPAGRHTVSAPVRDNLAVFPLAQANRGTFYANAASVTWYREDGTQTTFTDQNAAVPFPGAPAWPTAPRSPRQSDAPGNGPPSGESLARWRSRYGVLRRPQGADDRLAAARAAAVRSAPAFVPSLTRVVLDTHHALAFITLSAVNPRARPAHRRYVADVWSAVQDSTQSTSWDGFAPRAQVPLGAIVGRAFLEYSIVPDDVTKVAWAYTCSSGCGQLRGSPLVLQAHDNVVYSFVTAGSLSIDHATWYLRGGGRLHAGP